MDADHIERRESAERVADMAEIAYQRRCKAVKVARRDVGKAMAEITEAEARDAPSGRPAGNGILASATPRRERWRLR